MAGLNTELDMQQSADTFSAAEHIALVGAIAPLEHLKTHLRQPPTRNILDSLCCAIVFLPILMVLSICLALPLPT